MSKLSTSIKGSSVSDQRGDEPQAQVTPTNGIGSNIPPTINQSSTEVQTVGTLVGEKLSQALQQKTGDIKPEKLAKNICLLFDTLTLPKAQNDEAYQLFTTPYEVGMIGHVYPVVQSIMENITQLVNNTEGSKKNRLKSIVDALELLGVSKHKVEGKVFQDASLVFIAILESLGFQQASVQQMLYELVKKKSINTKTLHELLEIPETSGQRIFKCNNFTWRSQYDLQTKLQSKKTILLQNLSDVLSGDFPARGIAKKAIYHGNYLISEKKKDIISTTNHPYFDVFRQLCELLKEKAITEEIEHTASIELHRILIQFRPSNERDAEGFSPEAQAQLTVLKNTQSTILRIESELQAYYGYLPEQMGIIWSRYNNPEEEPKPEEDIWLQALKYKRMLPTLNQVEQALTTSINEVLDKLPTYILFQKTLAELGRNMQELDSAYLEVKKYSTELAQLKSQKIFTARSREYDRYVEFLKDKQSCVTGSLEALSKIDPDQIYIEALEHLNLQK